MGTRRSTLALVAVLLVQLVVLAIQDRPGSRADTRLRGWAVRAVGPLAGALEAVREAFTGAGQGLRGWGALRRENELLHAERQELELQLLRLYGIEGDLQRLAAAVDYQHLAAEPVAVADVVHRDTEGALHHLIVRLPSGEAVHNQPAVVPAGVVGRVLDASDRWARVQLVTDREAWIGAMIERTRRQALVSGGGDGRLLLQELPLQEDVRPGDHIVTSGTDGIYPRDLPIGTVVGVERGSELFHVVEVEPAVDPGQLTQVLLLPARDWPEPLNAPPRTASSEATQPVAAESGDAEPAAVPAAEPEQPAEPAPEPEPPAITAPAPEDEDAPA